MKKIGIFEIDTWKSHQKLEKIIGDPRKLARKLASMTQPKQKRKELRILWESLFRSMLDKDTHVFVKAMQQVIITSQIVAVLSAPVEKSKFATGGILTNQPTGEIISPCSQTLVLGPGTIKTGKKSITVKDAKIAFKNNAVDQNKPKE